MSGMTVTAFVYATNPTLLKNEVAQHRLSGVSLTHPDHSDSSLISALFVWLSIQHNLFARTDSFLLANDGIKLNSNL